MTGDPQPTPFRERIQARLQAAHAKVDRERDQIDGEMAALEQREVRFHEIAEQLLRDVVQPTLEEFASHFENADLEDPTRARRLRCNLRHCDRFPAQAHVELQVAHNDSIDEVILEFRAEILPVFVKHERDDAIRFALDNVDVNQAKGWAEEKLLGFVDSYLPIETHPQYQHENYVVDPVCGMRLMKTKSLSLQHAGRNYYFCAKTCMDRFAERPETFISMHQ